MTKETTLSKDYKSIVEQDEKYVMQTYTRQPIALESGKGSVVRDINGNEFIDCVAGIAVNNVGHCHPRVVEAISKQAEKLIHVSNIYYTDVQAQLAEELINITNMGRAFFCNSGTEAVEAAMKLARVTTGKTEFIAAEHSFHGRTMGSLTVTHKSIYRTPFEPLIQGEKFVAYNDAQAIRDEITKDTAAVIVEPIQGEGGINVPSDEYLKEVREICDENDMVLIFDEVQTGFGRTGKWFCKDHSKVVPDIMTMAKAIGGGFPMGAIVARDGISFGKSQHAATFGGGPLACAASLASIGVIRDEGLVDRSAQMGKYFMDKLNSLELDNIVEVRGRGLMIGVEINKPCADIVDLARENGVLLNCTSEKVIRIAPPLVITKEQIDTVVDVLAQI
ncbi:acetylornithine transaminase [Methanococcoides orientis]|uniref:acetylornithine transaminase n=1 Tax=Methanococcoides orientis TaxID=2822137 RepID=UPI001E496127|nr:acetylornithine transaminase [Methanococcoides orientis]UGV40755.1 acetylornithine transaminase [Methanococcoides orientis]